MTAINQEFLAHNKMWIVVSGLMLVLVVAALMTPNLVRTRVPQYSPTRLEQVSPPGDSTSFMSANLTSTFREETHKVGSSERSVPDRKMVRTGSIEAVVQNPVAIADKIRGIATDLGGYVESIQNSGADKNSTASITIRVPVTRFEEAKSDIGNLGLRIEHEKMEAADVTRQYVDTDARIRNLRAEEAQYLQILKAATRVKDMLDVTEKLSDVRGEIEQQQAEFQALSRQVETVALNISLHGQADAELFGLNWRPLYQIKVAAHDALDNLADYAVTMVAVIFEIPVALLWLATIGFACFLCWRAYVWTRKAFFRAPKVNPASSAS